MWTVKVRVGRPGLTTVTVVSSLSALASSTPVRVMVCGTFQLPGVKVKEAGITVASARLSAVAVIVTAELGATLRVTAKSAVAPSARFMVAVLVLTITTGVAVSTTGVLELLCEQFCMKKKSPEMATATKRVKKIFFLYIDNNLSLNCICSAATLTGDLTPVVDLVVTSILKVIFSTQ